MQALRFPALSLRVWQLMLPGAVFGAVVCIAGDDVRIQGISNLGATPNVAAGVMALLVVIAYHALDAYFMIRLVLPSMVFAAWPQSIATILLHSPVDRLLLPEGRWVPNSIAELVAVPLLPMRTARLSQLRFFALLMTYVLSCCSALSRSASATSSCSAFPLLLAVMYILHVLVLIALQPHRNPAERAAAPATDLCFSAICVLKYANANSDASSTLQLLLSVIMVVSTVHSLWVRYRLSLALGSEEDDDGGQGGGKEIPLLKIMSDVGSSHAITGHSTTETPPLHYAATAPLGTHVKDVVSIAIVGSVQPATFDTVLQQQRKVQQHDNSSRVQSNSTATTATSVVMPPPPPSVKQIASSEWPSVAPSDSWVDDTDL